MAEFGPIVAKYDPNLAKFGLADLFYPCNSLIFIQNPSNSIKRPFLCRISKNLLWTIRMKSDKISYCKTVCKFNVVRTWTKKCNSSQHTLLDILYCLLFFVFPSQIHLFEEPFYLRETRTCICSTKWIENIHCLRQSGSMSAPFQLQKHSREM